MTLMNIDSLHQLYKTGELTPQKLIDNILSSIAKDTSSNAWIYVLSKTELDEYIEALGEMDFSIKPLWGIPFAIKDNIDLANVPTTAACPEYAYTPDDHAFVVKTLINAGAIPLGKTNLDQFATGLVGTRSPHGAVTNTFDKEFISGGSSSGSAHAVARGWVSFALGTDTAGSGRVPAAFNNIIGTKPSIGLLSCSGVVPACRSLDCVTFFSLCPTDAQTLLNVAAKYDENDAYARPDNIAKGLPASPFKVGVPAKGLLEFFGNVEYPELFSQACLQLEKAGAELVEIDLAPFINAAKLLYQGPWVAERYHAVGEFIQENTDLPSLDRSVKSIISAGGNASAVDAFDGFYRLQAFKRVCDRILNGVDCIVTPTAGQHYTIAQMQEDPIGLNANLGYYTNFMNLLDYAAISVPAGFTSQALPFGITLFAPALHDQLLLDVAARYLSEKNWGMGVVKDSMPVHQSSLIKGYIPVAVCGAHLKGMPLNWQLLERGAKFIEATTTSTNYRFYALAGGPPHRPGLIRVNENEQSPENCGAAIAVEVWAVPSEYFGSFVAGIPAPLGIGKIELIDGRWVPGFICEPGGVAGAEDITEFANWRGYIKRMQA